MTTTIFQVEPVVSYPREAVIGQTYLLTIDLRGPGGPAAWPFAEEEYAVYCLIEGGMHFSSRPLGEPAVVLHRFGGTYGPAEFLLTVQDAPATLATLNLLFVSSFGAPLGSAGLPIAVVAQSSAAVPVVGHIAGEPERPQTKQTPEPKPAPIEAPVAISRLHIRIFADNEEAKYAGPIGNGWQVAAELSSFDGITQTQTGSLSLNREELRARNSEADQYGLLLGEALFQGGIRELWDVARQREGVIRLQLELPPELDELHWERLLVPVDYMWRMLNRFEPVWFSRYVPARSSRNPAPLERSELRVLLLAASPTNLTDYNLQPLDVERAGTELRAVIGTAMVTELTPDTRQVPVQTLIEQLERAPEPFSILHIYAHSRMNADNNEIGLFLSDSDGRVSVLTTTELLKWLSSLNPERLPRMVVLQTGPAHALARALVEQLSIPFVLTFAEGTPISAADRIIQDFYSMLLMDGEVDRVLQVARRSVAAFNDALIFITNTSDLRLFTPITSEPAQEQAESPFQQITQQTADMPPIQPAGNMPPAPEPAPTASGWSWPLILMAQSGPGAGIELYPNGIDGLSGQPLLRIDAASAVQIALNGGIQTASPEQSQQTQTPTAPFSERADTELYRTKVRAQEANFGVSAGIDADQLEQARWAVVVHANDPDELIQALWPLIAHRCSQMGFTPPEVTFNPGEDCATWWNRHSEGGKRTLRDAWGVLPPVLIYRPGEPVNQWLARHGVAIGPVDPVRGVPYYLLLAGRPGAQAGDPATIPFSFQQQLGVFYAVGRLTFTNPDGTHRYGDYAIYAERVLFTEQRGAAPDRLRRELAFFSPRHNTDPATQRSAAELLQPLAEWAMRDVPRRQGFQGRIYLDDQATRRNLEALLDATPPAILMLAGHGVGMPPGDARQFTHQGALVTQDWDGFGSIRREHWFAGEDLGAAALHGMFAILHASYSLGSPQEDSAIADAERGRLPIAPFAFIAQLPQQLLLHGTLAVCGNIERVWTYPSSTTAPVVQSQPFEDLLGRLVRGSRIGDALDQFGVTHATMAMQLADELENIRFGKQVDPAVLAVMWMARNNARSMLLLGDPAVRLPFGVHEAA